MLPGGSQLQAHGILLADHSGTLDSLVSCCGISLHSSPLQTTILGWHPILLFRHLLRNLLSSLLQASFVLPTGSSLGRWGLFCSIASAWWNPKFNNLNVGFTTHITGYKHWYKHQLILLVVRGLFYFVMANEDFAISLDSSIAAAHLFILVFVTFVS